MNAERLHAITLILKEEMRTRATVERLQSLVESLQNVVNASNQATQQTLATARSNFFISVTDAPSDSFSPAWRQILIEIGGDIFFGSTLKQAVEKILTENQMTPAAALSELQSILKQMKEFKQSLDQAATSFNRLGIGSETLSPGEAEIGILIPRSAVKDQFGEFADELDELEFILDSLSQAAGGRKEDLKIKTLSSSGLMVYLLATPWVAACVAKSVDLVVGQYLKLLQVRKLQLEIERLEVPDEISDKMKEHANNIMAQGIEKFTVQIINEFHKGKDGERKNELNNAVTISLNKIANRIDKGFNIEVRIEPPTAGAAKPNEERAQEVIKAAAENMQYLKLEGPPILALPEKIPPSEPKTKHKPPAQKD